jgi:uncharacterized protein (DUF1810 family)
MSKLRKLPPLTKPLSAFFKNESHLFQHPPGTVLDPAGEKAFVWLANMEHAVLESWRIEEVEAAHLKSQLEQRSDTASFDLQRFVSAQQETYEDALAELQRWQKESHWMWFIFPQIAGLGGSATSRRYAIQGLAEARAYLVHPTLGPRLLTCCQAVLKITGLSATDVFGHPDDAKLRSSMTLFASASPADSVFTQVMDKYFAGQVDQKTIELLKLYA